MKLQYEKEKSTLCMFVFSIRVVCWCVRKCVSVTGWWRWAWVSSFFFSISNVCTHTEPGAACIFFFAAAAASFRQQSEVEWKAEREEETTFMSVANSKATFVTQSIPHRRPHFGGPRLSSSCTAECHVTVITGRWLFCAMRVYVYFEGVRMRQNGYYGGINFEILDFFLSWLILTLALALLSYTCFFLAYFFLHALSTAKRWRYYIFTVSKSNLIVIWKISVAFLSGSPVIFYISCMFCICIDVTMNINGSTRRWTR